MESLDHYVDWMNQLLDELIQVATQLREMSLQVIAEEDVISLQKHQEELLLELEKVDQQIKVHYRHQLSSEIEKKWHQQLKSFQQLNQEFIENVNVSHGLIQFELHRAENEEGQDFSHLNKIFSSPNRSKTVEPEKNEES